MKNLLLALQFLTIIPVRVKYVDEKRIARALIYFPLIGLLLGVILTGIDRLLFILRFEQFISNVILVILLVVLTGGLHMDGLADTFDALLSRKNREDMLRIMRDSHIGVMGVLAIISVILLKIAFLSSLNAESKIVTLLLMCILSRWSLVLAMFLFPYARQEGKAKAFIEGINFEILTLATLIALICAALIWQIKGIFIMAMVGVSSYLIARFINSRINGLTGDTLGAINELVEVIILFGISILERINLWII